MRPALLLLACALLPSMSGLLAQSAAWAPLRTFAITWDPSTGYDPARQRIVQFGGAFADGVRHTSDETWEWDGDHWLPRYPPTKPPARTGAPLVYDYVRNTMIMFGGSDQRGRPLGDMWEWDGLDWRQIQVPVMPPAREYPSMATDPLRRRIVLFGGRNMTVPAYYNDTWEWDGVAWQQAVPLTMPWPRVGATMAYCLSNQRMVLYGGGYLGWLIVDCCYEWDGTDWTLRTAGRPPVSHGNLVSTPWNGHVVLHSGVDVVNNNYVYRLNTWDYDGTTWRQLPTTSWPGWRGGWSLCAFEARQEVVYANGIFDGNVDPVTNEYRSSHPGTVPGELEQDMWFLRQGDWIHKARSLVKRLDVVAAAHDASRDSTVLIVNQGSYWGYPNPTMQTWALDGGELHQLNVVNPPPRSPAALAYHPGLRRVVMYGGQGSNSSGAVHYFDTWTFDGAQWLQDTSLNHPLLSQGATITYDPTSNSLLMSFYGESTIWRWQGNGWTPWPAAQLPVANNAAWLECDPARGRLVMYGFFQTLSGTALGRRTYEFDGTSWQLMNPVHTPVEVFVKFLRYVPWLGGVAMIGRTGAQGTWVWDGTDWRRASLEREMFNGYDTVEWGALAAAYADSRGELQVFQNQLGGMDGTGSLVWSLRERTLTATSQHPRMGGSLGFSFDVPRHPGGLCAVLFSSADHPGIDLGCADGIWLPLANRPMLQASLGFGLWTLLDAAGQGAVAPIQVPNSTGLIGFSMFAAGLVLDPATGRLATATNALSIDVNP